MFESLAEKGFQVLALHHAEAILVHDMSKAIEELEAVLQNITIPIETLIRGGGGEGVLTQSLRNTLSDCGWKKHNFEIGITIDGEKTQSLSHEIDHVKRFGAATFALEIEWNNKDPFFDRDLENFKRLHANGAISIGGIVTRGDTLQGNMKEFVQAFALKNDIDNVDKISNYYDLTKRQKKLIEDTAARKGNFAVGWAQQFVADKFGEATTHWRKLMERVERGVGNPCPLLFIGIPQNVVTI